MTNESGASAPTRRTDLELGPDDRALLDGDKGPAAARAMRLLVQYGRALAAERFIPIASAHIDGCLYHGPASLDFARKFVDDGGRVAVPTTLNVGAVDLLHPDLYPGRSDLIEDQAELIQLHEALGCVPTLTCAPYQRLIRPAFGEHVAWAESNAIVFANSVLGARTDRYGDFTDLCAAIAGRVPYAGLHRDENRRATLRIDLPGPGAGLPRDLYFSAVGYLLGELARGRVAVLTGLPDDTQEYELKMLGAAAATSGSVALFHAAGLTPEAPTVEVAAGRDPADIDVETVSLADLQDAVGRLCPIREGDAVDAVCLGTPHYSLDEFAALARAVEGRRRADNVEVFVSTSRAIAAQVKADPAMRPLWDFGVRLVLDTCTYIVPVVRTSDGAILTTSAKWAHYAPGNIGRRAGLASLEQCLRSAELGRMAPP